VKTGVKERMAKQVDALLAEGRAVLATKFSTSRPGYINLGDPFVDSHAFRKWLTGCQNFIHQIGPSAKVWETAFTGSLSNSYGTANALCGCFASLKEAIDGDLLTRVEDLVLAEALGDLLNQATELLDKGYGLAAGVLCRAALEERLRGLCHRYGYLPLGRPTIEVLKQALVKGGHLSKIDAKNVDLMAGRGNYCAHNEQPPLPATDVETLIRDVTSFLANHPLP
jgi:hypothetical protein